MVLLIAAMAQPVWSWNAHSLLTRAALATVPGLTATVRTEELTQFLEAEADKLARVLAEIEARASDEFAAYAERPAALAFNPAARGDALRESFLRAIRVNPRVPLGLYRQPAPGETPGGRATLETGQYSLIGAELAGNPMEVLGPGEPVSALDVLATGSDEPDYGLDVGLYANNEGPLAAAYGFGEQPFGNPALSYGSQAPFHMAFPREDPIIALAAPFSTQSQAGYREIQYSTLARFAFQNGHPYWGWRFAGWALHYAQDLGQPYHARMIPGQGTLDTLALNVFGSDEDINGALILLSNRHLAMETYAGDALKDVDNRARWSFEAALAGTGTGSVEAPAYRKGWIYDVVAAGAYEDGRKLDKLVADGFPVRYVNDPGFDFGLAQENGNDTWEPYGGTLDEAARARLDAALTERYRSIGAETRTYLAYLRDPAAIAGERKAPFDQRGMAYIVVLVLLSGGIVALMATVVRKSRRRAGISG
jgi:hypothetical protein